MTKEDENRLFDSINLLKDAIIDVHEKVESSHNKPTPWGSLGTWAAVVIAVVASVGGLAINPMWGNIADNKQRIVALEERSVETRIKIAKLETIKTQE
ncbi:MAG: hypothetical protein HRT63_11550 [Erythrobacter sp.]|nr:hypothetical protein [Erythrobacter sp.]